VPLVSVACDPALPVVWADHDRLEQVFVNLLGNAIGHNPAGTQVAVSATLDGPGEVVITVADDGTGLPPDMAASPFEPARRRRTATSGAGLGLSISRGIVTAHGGRIELAAPDRGTCFLIRLPVEAPVLSVLDVGPAQPPARLTGSPARAEAGRAEAGAEHGGGAGAEQIGVVHGA
jgi:signal transduction histidine kinase